LDNPEEMTVTERAALAGWLLARGKQLTTQEAADTLGLTYIGAYRLLQRLSRVLPVRFDQPVSGLEGYWYSIE
jgi:hypothetical protein